MIKFSAIFCPPLFFISGARRPVAVPVCSAPVPKRQNAELSTILSTTLPEVTRKTHSPHQIWAKKWQRQRYIACSAGFGVYQLSLNHLNARFNDRAG
jgi:hypothetical protein